MAGPKDTFPAQRRSSVVAQFVASIQSVPEGPKRDQLDALMADFQSSLQGMTGEQASAACIQFIHDCKAIVRA